MRNQVLGLGVALALGGCATLTPDAVYVTAEHESHITQHEPFAAHPTRYGRNMLGAQLEYQLAPRVTLQLQDSYSVEGRDGNRRAVPREVFQATVKVQLWHK